MDSPSTPPSEPPAPRPKDSVGEGLHSSAGAPEKSVADAQVSNRRSQPLRWRLVLLVMAIVVGVTCLGGVGVGYVLYYRVSEPDRSTPTVVVDQYLQATFDDRDERRAGLFTCGDPQRLSDMQAMLNDIKDLEKDDSIRITVRWEGFEANVTGASATVNADLIVITPAGEVSSRSIRRWQFGLKERSGWRVCEAHRIG